MARRLMSRRGGSASQPQVTPYQQIELDDGWREWENTKQELALVKRQLTEKDALVIQLKTASRRLQETLRKKDKDLQAAFAILRSPQDAKTTKTRKQELIDRLVSECMQRAATAEALAEERRRELDRLRYSSKFLRFQELEAEIEECHTEIGRLRAKLETAPGSPTIAGKLKVSSVPLVANGSGGLVKNTRLDPLKLAVDDSPGNRTSVIVPNNLAAARALSSKSTAGQVRVVPLAKLEHREGFVSKTRRKALEAEYYKQVRLAQLEVECELEENLHIRAAREATKLQAIEHNNRRVSFEIDSARLQEAAEGTVESNYPQVQSILAEEPALIDHTEERRVWNLDPTPSPDPTPPTANTEGPIDSRIDEMEQPVWNLNPSLEPDVGANPVLHPMDSDNAEEFNPEFVDDDGVDDKTSVGTNHAVDPSLPDTISVAEPVIAEKSESNAWNVDPNPPLSSSSPTDTNIAVHEESIELSQKEDVASAVGVAGLDHLAQTDSDNHTAGSEMGQHQAWNLDPSSVATDSVVDPENGQASDDDGGDEDEDGSTVWNLDPHGSGNNSKSISSSTEAPDAIETAPTSPQVEAVADEQLDSSLGNDAPTFDDSDADMPGVPESAEFVSPPGTNENSPRESEAETPAGNDTPDHTQNASSAVDADLSGVTETLDPAQNEEPSVPEATSAGADGGVDHIAEAEPDEPVSETNLHNAWNLDPSGATADPVTEPENAQINDDDEVEGERTVWNLNPCAGNASEPTNSSTEAPDAQETAPPSTQVEDVADEQQLEESSSGNDAATFAYSDADMADVPEPAENASPPETNENSPRESEGETPAEDDTPDYTPPSTGRDSDAAGDEDGDATW